MNQKFFIPFFAFFTFLALFSQTGNAQNQLPKNNIDTNAIKKRVAKEYDTRDSILNAMKQRKIDDSIARALEKIKIQQYRDSLTNARNQKRIKDSTDRALAKQKIINEKRAKDSLELVQKNRTKDSMNRVLARQDSIKNAERQKQDSIAFARARIQDSIATARQKIADSARNARIQQQKLKQQWDLYVNSKHYKDSVAARKNFVNDSIKKERLTQQIKTKQERDRINDSIKIARKNYNDSIVAERNRINDSIKTALNQENERLREERQRYKDSMLAARDLRMDSLKAIRAENEKKAEARKTVTEEKKKKALALKVHSDKQKEWSNEKLLKKKWGLHRRIYQNTVTRYNYYYNAKRKYDDAVKKLSANHKDEYTKNISLYEYNIAKDGASVSSDMDTVIKKASFSTQIHDPRSKWFDNLYFLMGKASYVKNDFDGAITTFQFIANEYRETKKSEDKLAMKKGETLSMATKENRKGLRKLRHHPIRNDALLWLAKSYIMAEQYGEAQSLLSILQKDKDFPERKKSELFLTKAQLDIDQNNQDGAIESLELALKQNLGEKQRSRTEFLLGQMYAGKNDFSKSTEHFKKSISGKNNPEMDFYTKLNIAINASKGGGSKDYAKSELQKIISDSKYENYRSEALNTLAAIEETDDMAKAADLLKKSIKNPLNKDLKQKAIAFASLGNIYYKLSEYELAKTSYDSASVYGSNPPIDNLAEVNLRKSVLGEIVNYIKTIKMQDSMLILSKKSEKEQKAAAKRELDKLKKQKENQAAPNELQVVALQPSGPVKSNWYFYNNALMQKGNSEFTQKWGNRKLEDNWRRITASSNFNTAGSEEGTEEGAENEKDNVNGMTISSLLALLPNTPAKADAAHEKIQDAYYNLGLAYFSQLQDYMNAIKSFDTLVSKYPATPYKQQSYYALYLNYEKLNQKNAAQRYKNLLIEQFGQTEFAQMAINPNYKEDNKNKSKNIFEHYDNTYQLYKEGKYQEAIDRVSYAKNAYKEHPIQAKYALVEAVSEAGLHDIPKTKLILEDIIKKYPNSDEQIRAQEILNLILTQNPADSGAVAQVISPNLNKYEDSLEASKAFKDLRDADGKGNYIFNTTEEHFVMIFIKNVDGKTMALKSAMSDYNMLKNIMQEYTTGLNLLTAQQGVLSIQKFPNAVSAKKYLTDLAKENLIFSQFKKNEYELSLVSIVNFGELLRTRDILGYMRFYKKNYK